jgi:hypothetical protein
MSLTREDLKDQTTALTVHVHAPDNVGFTHTIGTRFTYFEGSKSGSSDTFGLSAKALNRIFQEFVKKFYVDEMFAQRNKELPALPPEIRTLLDICAKELELMANKLQAKQLYNTSSEMVKIVIESGHIPLIMSKCTAAAQYNIATRNLGAEHLERYFDLTLGAKPQAIEYVSKIKMMTLIAGLYSDINTLRFQKYNDRANHNFYACTRLLIGLNENVIKVNQKSMPQQYVQFDLAPAFTDNIFKLICRMNPKLAGETFIDQLMGTLHLTGDKTVDTQEAISKRLYVLLEDFLIKYGLNDDEIEIDDELDAILQEVLPLAAYLNSEFNPFARNGIFGKVLTNKFHKEALDAYRQHELGCSGHFRVYDPFVYKYNETTRTEEFDGDQLDRLINGAEEPEVKPTGATARGLFARLTDTSSVSSAANSQSAARREQLALPTPAVYTQMYLTSGKEEEKKDNTKRPGNK